MLTIDERKQDGFKGSRNKVICSYTKEKKR
jgi:hypothetical protein